MGLGKWIGGVVGFMAMGPLGALAGYAIGSMLDGVGDLDQAGNGSFSGNGTSQNGTYGNPNAGYQDDSAAMGQRNSFLFSLLVMASYIIRADGKVMHSEMEYVRNFLRVNFGEQAVSEGQDILMRLFEQRKQMDQHNPMAFKNTIRECGVQIAQNLSYEERLQLLSFLANIAKSDGNVCSEEIEALKEVALSMQLSLNEVDSMLNLGGNSLEQAYKVLEIEPTATDDEVRTAYRKLALKHHPDRVATLGEDIRKAAEVKFQQINNAKDIIYKARGLK